MIYGTSREPRGCAVPGSSFPLWTAAPFRVSLFTATAQLFSCNAGLEAGLESLEDFLAEEDGGNDVLFGHRLAAHQVDFPPVFELPPTRFFLCGSRLVVGSSGCRFKILPLLGLLLKLRHPAAARRGTRTLRMPHRGPPIWKELLALPREISIVCAFLDYTIL